MNVIYVLTLTLTFLLLLVCKFTLKDSMMLSIRGIWHCRLTCRNVQFSTRFMTAGACKNHTLSWDRKNYGSPSLFCDDKILLNQQSKECELLYDSGSSSCVPMKTLSSQLENLRMDISGISQRIGPKPIIQEYILPTTTSNSTHKKILDPEIIQRQYELPSHFNMVQELLTPGLESFVPKVDPNLFQSIIDQGSMPIVKHSMPYMLRIRRHKMKKHKLKKFRKRMIFVHRKLAEVKQRKKERRILEFQRKWIKLAEDYDPEKFVDDRLALARKGGYGKALFADSSKR